MFHPRTVTQLVVQANGVSVILHQCLWSVVKLLSPFMYFHTELCRGKFADSVH